MNPDNIATELDMRIAVALSLTADSTAPLAGAVRRLNSIHEGLKSQHASGLLNDEDYAKEAGGLLKILCNFDGLIAESTNGTSRR